MKNKTKQASSSVQLMMYLYMMTGTVNPLNVCMYGQWSQWWNNLLTRRLVKYFLCDDKNFQSTMFVHMWPVKQAMKSSHIWSVTKSSHMQSVEPAILQSTYKKFNQVSLCDDKNCQSTKKHSHEECQVRPGSLCDDKNYQSAKCAHMWTVKQQCHNLATIWVAPRNLKWN